MAVIASNPDYPDWNPFGSSSTVGSGMSASGFDIDSLMSSLNGISSANTQASSALAQEQRDWSSGEAAVLRQFNADEAAKNRDWQKMMSDTAHQREVADLRAAGLNPVLSALNGSGATVTSGATASGSMPSGSAGEADKSSTTALVTLLGSLLNRQTQLETMRMSAENNLAVAEKYNATSELVAAITGQATTQAAGIHAAASMYGSDRALEASKYSADMSNKNVKFSSMMSYMQGVNTAKLYTDATRYSADQAYKAAEYSSDASIRKVYHEMVADIGTSAARAFLNYFLGNKQLMFQSALFGW
ncbi:DNA pilot protein [Peromfec virus RodF8_43]|uniref:DNA pilot protein n=1 Tax=Peromfec virus RodF8_43 TaxID=2929376 RepID=A0A976N1S5_9VIRU|nr:DNA pilot protein [Peromfec virus RodF8_43]